MYQKFQNSNFVQVKITTKDIQLHLILLIMELQVYLFHSHQICHQTVRRNGV
jgi:hypothetical protein